MNIASLVVRAKPEDFAALEGALAAIPGVELHGKSAEGGHLIVTVEDGEGYSTADSILAVSQAERVQAITIAYEYTDEGLELQEA